MTLVMLFFGIWYIFGVQTNKISPKIRRIYSALFTIVISAETFVTIAFWLLMSWSYIPAYVSSCSHPVFCHIFNFLIHGFPAVITWIMLITQPTHFARADLIFYLAYIVLFFAIHIPCALLFKPLYSGMDFTKLGGYLWSLVFLAGLISSFKLCEYVSNLRSQNLNLGH